MVHWPQLFTQPGMLLHGPAEVDITRDGTGELAPLSNHWPDCYGGKGKEQGSLQLEKCNRGRQESFVLPVPQPTTVSTNAEVT